MDRELWQRAESLFHAALERPPESRHVFLVEACGDDDDLRRQVEALVAKADDTTSFLEKPALVELEAPERARASLVGRQVGAYRVVSLLGAGGMGEVYRARDDRLGRDVALKTLPPAFASDPRRLTRFRGEARTLASLNHPNIAAAITSDTGPPARASNPPPWPTRRTSSCCGPGGSAARAALTSWRCARR